MIVYYNNNVQGGLGMDLISEQLYFIRKLISLMIIVMTVVTLYFPTPEDGDWEFMEAARDNSEKFPFF